MSSSLPLAVTLSAATEEANQLECSHDQSDELTNQDEIHARPLIGLVHPSVDGPALDDHISRLHQDAFIVVEHQRQRSADEDPVIDRDCAMEELRVKVSSICF